jgi:DNA/RNA-binding domain of Phe-tRNA-synthetase-like protein
LEQVVAFELSVDPCVRDLALGLVEVAGATIGPGGAEQRAACEQAVKRVAAEDMAGGESRRAAVRQLLRYGGFKPSGRSKPAQEYLLRSAAQDGMLPEISNVVDLINVVSLESGLPISLISLDRVGRRLAVRYGAAGERYVFNRGGQELDVSGLICLCAGGRDDAPPRPVGSPVKDSLLAKVDESDRNLLACVYAAGSSVAPLELAAWCERLSDGFRAWCGAAACDVRTFPETW